MSPCTRLQISALTLLGLVLTASACTSSHDDPVATPTGSTARGTAAAPTPPADPAEGVRRAVTAAQERYYRAYLAAGAKPGDQTLVNDLLALYTADAAPRQDLTKWMAGLASRGFAGRPGPDSYYVIEKIETSRATPATAVATVCGYDDGVIVDARQRAPDGREIVVNDEPISERTLFTWVNQDGWRIRAVQTVRTWNGENGCPPRSVPS